MLVACLKIASNGPAEELMMVSMSPATKSRTIKKIEPVTIPITTQPIMIRGPTTEGLGISGRVSVFFIVDGVGYDDGTFNHVGDAILVLLAVYIEGMRGDIHIQ